MLSLFFFCGACSCASLAWPQIYQILTNQAPTGDPDDNLWKWIMLGALLVLLLVKAPLLKAIADKQIARIDSLEVSVLGGWGVWPSHSSPTN
jgi:hypothetical protein